MDYDDNSYTSVDERRAGSGPRQAPRATPRMLPAETVMPTVSYRTPVGPASRPATPAMPRTVTPSRAPAMPPARTAAASTPPARAGSPTPSSALPTAAYRVGTDDAHRHGNYQTSAEGTAPIARITPVPASLRAPTPAHGVRTTTPSTGVRALTPDPARHAPPLVECDPEMSVVEMMPRAPRAASTTPAPLAQTSPRGELTVVFGCRGGAGSTTLAVNTAAALVRSGKTVCIVDLDLQLGDVCVALDLEPQTSLASVAREVHALDGTSLRRRLAQHGSGVCALTQVGHVDDLDAALPARLPGLLDTLRQHFDHVIVDGVRDFGDVALAALEAATRILVVVTQDVPAVRRASRVITLLGRLAIEESRCSLIVNRAARRASIDDAAIERALGLPIAGRVREDAKVAEALDAGALLVDIARSRTIVEDIARVALLCRGGV